MRQVMSISLPPEVVEEIKNAAREEHCATPSEFIRHLMRLWRTDALCRDIEVSEREFAEGKGKILKSLKDLR